MRASRRFRRRSWISGRSKKRAEQFEKQNPREFAGILQFMGSLPFMSSGPSPLIRKIFSEHIANYGEPDQSYRFDSRHTRSEILALDVLDVMIWRPTDDCEMTTFATIGMAERPMKDASHRVELHFAIRGKLSAKEESESARFLADIAVYPFFNDCNLNWWHTIRQAEIPQFARCCAILFHPAFVENGWQIIECDEMRVHLLNVVPITKEELELKRKDLNELVDYLADSDIDLFCDRSGEKT